MRTQGLKKILRSDTTVLVGIIILISVIFGAINPSYFSGVNLINIARTGLEDSIFAIAVLLIMIAGGIDMSFMAIASFAMYAAILIVTNAGYDAPIIVLILMVAGFGILLGLLNAFFVCKTNLPAFIVTLGTSIVIKGATIILLGTSYITVLPTDMGVIAKTYLLTAAAPDGSKTGLSILVLFVAILYVATALLLKYTRFGRNMYAIGGDKVAATRAGINITATTMMVFGLSGAVAGIGGLVHATLMHVAVPGDLVGNELDVIAAVILGGAQADRGRGSVLQTILGVLIITIISSNLTLIKVPTHWQQAVLGVVILGGTLIQGLRSRKG